MEEYNEKNHLNLESFNCSKLENRTFAKRQNLKKRFYNLRLKYAELENSGLIDNVKQYKILIDEDFPINFQRKKRNSNIEIEKVNNEQNCSLYTGNTVKETDYNKERYNVFLSLKENKEPENVEFNKSQNSFFISGKDNIKNRKRINSIKELISNKLEYLQTLLSQQNNK